MNRLLVATFALCSLGMTACQPESSKSKEREEPRSSLQFTPDAGPELTAAQVEDFRTYFKKNSLANAASLILISPDETTERRDRRNRDVEAAPVAMKTLLSSIKANCQIQQPTRKETGDSSARGREATTTTTGSILGERCPVATTTQHSRSVLNETFNPADATGRLYMNLTGGWSYELKDPKNAGELGLLAEKLSLSAKGPIDYYGNRLQGDIRGGGRGTWQFNQTDKTDYNFRIEMVITSAINGGRVSGMKVDSAMHLQTIYKNLDYRLSIHMITMDGKDTKDIFLNGKKISGEGFEDFSPGL